MDADQLLIHVFQIEVTGGKAVPFLERRHGFFEPFSDRFGEIIIKGVPVEEFGKTVAFKEVYVVRGIITVMILDRNFAPGQVFVERIYQYAFKYYKMGYATAFSWILFLLIFIVTVLQFKLQRRWVSYDT